MIFQQMVLTGGDRNYGYLIGDEINLEAALIDPSYMPEQLVMLARRHHLTVKYIINTHDHDDHTNGNKVAKEITDAQIAASKHSSIKPDIARSFLELLPVKWADRLISRFLK